MTRQISESDAEALSKKLCAALGKGWRIESERAHGSDLRSIVIVRLLFKERVTCVVGWSWLNFLDTYCRYSSLTFLSWETMPCIRAGAVEELELKLAVLD